MVAFLSIHEVWILFCCQLSRDFDLLSKERKTIIKGLKLFSIKASHVVKLLPSKVLYFLVETVVCRGGPDNKYVNKKICK